MANPNPTLSRRTRGQTLVLACLLLLVTSLAVLATVQLGQTIHERVRLQNTADATAYSMAAMEARAFNLYAFANRTQASQYVSAMLFQSALSFLYFGEAFLTDVYGVMLTLEPCAVAQDAFWQVACPALKALPNVGPLLAFLEKAIGLFGVLVEAYQRALRSSAADEVIGEGIIPGLRTLNSALAQLSGEVMRGALAQVEDTAAGVLQANDPDVDAKRARAATGSLSACLFDRAHFREAFGSPLAPNLRPDTPLAPRVREERRKEARAKRAMAQVANGTRYGCDGEPRCPERFLTSRKLGSLLSLPGLDGLSGFLDGLPKWGQTRLLTAGLARGWNDDDGGNLLREPLDTPDAPSSMLAQGDNLGADDLYEIRLPGSLGKLTNPFVCPDRTSYWECWGEPRRGLKDHDGQRPYRYMMKTSVWALNDDERPSRGGIHWRVAFPDGYPAGKGYVAPNAREPSLQRVGLNEIHRDVFGARISIFVANVRPIEDGHHRWRGLAPFPHFEPGQFAEACPPAPVRNGDPSLEEAAARGVDFNQPSTWVALDKGPAALRNAKGAASGAGTSAPALLNGRGALSFAWGGRRGELVMEDRGEQTVALGFGPGLNAISRAQAYYHRPGDWTEQPNFFNPYWRPRLASVHQARGGTPLVQGLLDKLPPQLSAAPQKALTH